MTQQERILNYLITYGTITPKEAMEDLGIMRLGARIWDLKHAGHLIRAERESSVNRWGDVTSYARYRLIR